MTFCTLFDSYYLDKGIALYRSLDRCAKDLFKLYIFCFDDKSYEILGSMNLLNVVLIKSNVLENKRMLQLKKERTKAEYCWTCTPQIIEYVLDNFQEESVTYIDADLWFFSNPKPLFDEIHQANANVVITEHRFSNNRKDQRFLKRSGKYCVEFNYFDQSKNSRECLSWWKEKCLEWCYHLYEPERMGDQKYLEKFPQLFKGVHELQHLGGGVAPWNIGQYKLISTIDNSRNKTIRLMTIRPEYGYSKENQAFDLIFYHFQNIRYLGKNHVNISSGTSDETLKNKVYIPYLREIEKIRKELADYGLSFSVKKKYSSNKIVSFFQATILRYKVRYLSDIYNLNKL